MSEYSIRERYISLLNAIEAESEEDKKDDAEFVNERILNLGDYLLTVYVQQAELSSLNLRFSGIDIPEKVMDLDSRRHTAHEKAIDSVRQLNRLCRALGVPLIYEGDENNRQEIAAFCRDVVTNFFDMRTFKRK